MLEHQISKMHLILVKTQGSMLHPQTKDLDGEALDSADAEALDCEAADSFDEA